MWPFSRRSETAPVTAPKPTWLKLLILAFIGYALFLSSRPDEQTDVSPLAQDIEKIQEKVDLTDYKSRLFPNQLATLKIKEVTDGEGPAVICGQMVSVTYQAYLAQGNELEDRATAEKPLRFRLGSGHAMPVFEQGIMGMKVGGSRSIVAPPLMSYGLEEYRRSDIPPDVSTRFEMTIMEAQPAYPDVSLEPFRIMDVAGGNGAALTCGAEAKLSLNIWNMKNERLATAKEIFVTSGSNQHMLGIEQGIIGMNRGGVRMLILPPIFQKTLAGEVVKTDLALPDDEIILVEVTAMP